MQRIGRWIVHPTSLTQTLEHSEKPPVIASAFFVNPLVEFIHLAKLRPQLAAVDMSGFLHGLFQLPHGLQHSGANLTSPGDLSIRETISFSVVW